jgi:hypothetical protein
MAIVDRSTALPAPAPAVWAAVKTPHAFRFITRGILTMPAIRDRELLWQEGETVTAWVLLFGVVPFSKHRLHVARIDEAAMTLSSQEGGGLIRRWNHDIIVAPLDEASCEYRDVIDIDAGIFTLGVALYARWFYYMRQRRWRALAQELTS